MPMYEDQCKECGFVNEHLSPVTDQTVPCPQCGGETERLFSLAALSVFDGFDTRNIDRAGRKLHIGNKRELASLCRENGVVPAGDAMPPSTRFEKMQREIPKW